MNFFERYKFNYRITEARVLVNSVNLFFFPYDPVFFSVSFCLFRHDLSISPFHDRMSLEISTFVTLLRVTFEFTGNSQTISAAASPAASADIGCTKTESTRTKSIKDLAQRPGWDFERG